MAEEEPDIIEQGQGRAPRRALPLVRPRRVAVLMAGTAATVLVASAVVVVIRPWADRAALPSPCQLLPAATVAALVPGPAASTPAVFTTSTTTIQTCTWRTSGGTLLSLDAEYSSAKGQAQRQFSVLPDAVGPAFAAAIRPLPGIGDQAQAVIDTGFPDEVAIYLRVLSGSALLGVGYNSPRTGHQPLPGDDAILAKLIPAARTILTRLTRANPPAHASGVGKAQDGERASSAYVVILLQQGRPAAEARLP